MSARRGSGVAVRAALGLCFGIACARSERHAPALQHAALPPGVVAVVGGERVASGTLERIVREEHVAPTEACRRAVLDALYAAFARSDPAAAARVSVAERGVLARAVLEGLRADARALGPPSDDEVRAITAERWPELDRPPSVRTTHAVVLVKKPADDAAARALATELAAALADAANSADFLARARAFPSRGLELRAEQLPPVTPDGRMWDPGEHPPKPLEGTLDADFTRAAHALTLAGEHSKVVKSAFGYHVILLDERYPELRVPLEARHELLADEVMARRAKPELAALMTRLRASAPVSTDRAVEALTALVPVGP